MLDKEIKVHRRVIGMKILHNSNGKIYKAGAKLMHVLMNTHNIILLMSEKLSGEMSTFMLRRQRQWPKYAS